MLKRTRINLFRLSVSRILPPDQAGTLLLEPATRCASASMFAFFIKTELQASIRGCCLALSKHVGKQSSSGGLFIQIKRGGSGVIGWLPAH